VAVVELEDTAHPLAHRVAVHLQSLHLALCLRQTTLSPSELEEPLLFNYLVTMGLTQYLAQSQALVAVAVALCRFDFLELMVALVVALV
jgi:hypothetical protein